jgi:hypothetical protein
MPQIHTYIAVNMLISAGPTLGTRVVQVVTICYCSMSFVFTFGKLSVFTQTGRAYIKDSEILKAFK